MSIQEKRDNIDKLIASNLFEDYDKKNIRFYECPTGSGKSVISLKSAKLLRDKFNTSVIISTNSNKLAVDYLLNGKDDLLKYKVLKLEDGDIKLILGKANFVDKNTIYALINAKNENFKHISLEDFELWYEDEKKLKLVDLFLEDFNIDSRLKDLVSISDESEEIVTIKNFTEECKYKNTIFITNHLYLSNLIEILSIKKSLKTKNQEYKIKKLIALMYQQFLLYLMKPMIL